MLSFRKQLEQRVANKKNQIARHEKCSVNLEVEKEKMSKKIKVTSILNFEYG